MGLKNDMVTLLKSTNEMTAGMKKCRKCKKIKEISEFGPWKYSKDRKAYHCRECEKLRARKEREEHPERNRVRCIKAYRKHTAERKVSVKLWKLKNTEKVKIYSKRSYVNNIEIRRSEGNRYFAEHAAQIKQSDRYIRNLLCSRTILEPNDIPEELVALKRAQMKLKRTILEMQK